jgi:hypothetical protein
MRTITMNRRLLLATALVVLYHAHAICVADETRPAKLVPRLTQADGVWTVAIAQDDRLIGAADPVASAGLEVRLPGDKDFRAVAFRDKRDLGRGGVALGPTEVGELSLTLGIEPLGPGLLRRTLTATARKAVKFAARWSLSVANDGAYATFSGEEKARVVCDTLGGGPEYPGVRGETVPVAMVRGTEGVVGLLADSPGLWDNRCLIELDPKGRRLAVLCGDGHDARELRVVHDARDTYVGTIDGWQALAEGETRRFETWVFTSPARSHYDAQLAAHLALANARGWNSSALEAILRNTAYLNLRRNLLRDGKDEGRFIFISGIGYGWKQWVTDGFWQAVALDDAEKLAEAQRSVFLNRITYEDNAQYYLIWAALAKRGGQKPNATLVREAFDFIRKHEKEGIFYPPPLPGATKPKGFKTYMDLLEYDDDDAPVSNQGFHCGALLAARELGLPVSKEDIDRAIAGYRGMFHAKGGYFPTSIKQPQHVGQDTLYGAALTYAVFGEKVLTDETVLAHWQTSQRLATPYGLRVISLADGGLLPGHSGEYVYGGSWFLTDAANHLLAGLHGAGAEKADAALIKRIEAELAHVPAFHESISTVTGKPHGHLNYSWNSGYWWLRKQFRQRLGQTGPDPVAAEIDKELGVVRDADGLRLEPQRATLRPEK